MPNLKLESESFVFDPRPNYPLVTTVKRYWISPPSLTTTSSSEDDGATPSTGTTPVTLIFAHGTGFHKEHWAPCLEDLYALISEQQRQQGQEGGGQALEIREAWSIDAPNHGDAAVLNEKDLEWGFEPIFRWEDYGRVIHSFLAGLGTGVDVDFTKHKLVGVGHSMGAIATLLSINFFPSITFSSIILVEPMLYGQHHLHLSAPTTSPPASESSNSPLPASSPSSSGSSPSLSDTSPKPKPTTNTPSSPPQPQQQSFLAAASATRRDTWSSKEEAYRLMKSRKAWKVWDDRVLRIYVDSGLKELRSLSSESSSTSTGAEVGKERGVTLKCTRKQETASYNDGLSHSLIYRDFKRYTKRVPIHLIYGEINDYVPWFVKEDIINNAAGGVHNFASFSRVPGAGHLALQINPKGVAQRIYEALTLKQDGNQKRKEGGLKMETDSESVPRIQSKL
ncbi:hypothetical protein K435DRAFT_786453 [Dendrothele bispora CBS 962.96]|uniref:AB hydrolase-1 domain-containing protein n=1 Tax=Dendrothele bispora (strain CBS 962.96) TaxID=1314807 RepID=A0A4S8KRF6_DENBC|nr:hypothetical protein K435DRAFT_786453 [Dendrothele bispora CBS 962.96]